MFALLDLIKEKGISLKIINLGGGMCSQAKIHIINTRIWKNCNEYGA